MPAIECISEEKVILETTSLFLNTAIEITLWGRKKKKKKAINTSQMLSVFSALKAVGLNKERSSSQCDCLGFS